MSSQHSTIKRLKIESVVIGRGDEEKNVILEIDLDKPKYRSTRLWTFAPDTEEQRSNSHPSLIGLLLDSPVVNEEL